MNLAFGKWILRQVDLASVPMPLGSFDRDDNLRRLSEEHFDLLVIGGGITGAGVALDAAARGLRTALIERDDLASGTSSKSSKLVHGGLRYLQQKEFRLVYEALHERQRLLRNAPHLVRVLPFLIPLLGKDGTVNRAIAKAYGTALWLYDLTGGWRLGRLHQKMDRDEALGHLPTLDPDRLVAAFIYYDATADDARLTLTIARTAALDHGAAVANHTAATGFVRDGSGRICAVEVTPAGQETFTVAATTVVNASGVWADEVRTLESGLDPDSIRPAKGVHITVPWSKVRNDIAAVLPVSGDRRSVFVVRWDDRTYIGTTDTDYDGSLDHPVCTDDDIDYLLGAVNASLSEPLVRSDVVATWAGLRPLVKSASPGRTADLSRRHQVESSDGGLITVTGGKLTTYRKMAADTVDAVLAAQGRRARGKLKSTTGSLPLRGSAEFEELARDVGLEPDDRQTSDGHGGEPASLDQHLVRRYGGEARDLMARLEADPSLAEPLVPGLPYAAVEAVHAVESEMATDLHDVLDRRTRARLLDARATIGAADGVAALIGPLLGWDADRQQAEAASYRAAVIDELHVAGLDGALDAASGA